MEKRDSRQELEHAWRGFCAEPGEDSFCALYTVSKSLVYTICSRFLGNEDDSLDAFQGTYARLLAIAREPQPAAGAQEAYAIICRASAREADRLRKQIIRRQAKETPMASPPDSPDTAPAPASPRRSTAPGRMFCRKTSDTATRRLAFSRSSSRFRSSTICRLL